MLIIKRVSVYGEEEKDEKKFFRAHKAIVCVWCWPSARNDRWRKEESFGVQACCEERGLRARGLRSGSQKKREGEWTAGGVEGAG